MFKVFCRHWREIGPGIVTAFILGCTLMAMVMATEMRTAIARFEARQARVEQLVSAVAPLKQMQAMAGRFEKAGWDLTDASCAVGIIYRCSKEHKVDEYLVEAMIVVESARQVDATSSKGATCLMQLMPVHLAPGEDPYDYVLSIEKGTAYIAKCIRKSGGNVRLGLYRYHGSDPKKPLESSIEYADAVITEWQELRGFKGPRGLGYESK
jgi:soluble lytic murein transglycosylase-like protein